MESTTFIIILGSVFIFVLILLAAILIMVSQKRKSDIQVKYTKLEINRQKEISENTLLSQEKERQKLGLELHDELGPSFSTIRINMDRMKQLIANKEYDQLLELSEQTSTDLKEAIHSFSDMSKVLYPVALQRHGLAYALTEQVERANSLGKSNFSLQFKDEEISKEVTQLAVYRICQELINNALKHAKASTVKIEIAQLNDNLRLTYVDDGVGFNRDTSNSGLGLDSISGRVNALDGEIEFRSKPTEGVNVVISLPNETIS